MNFAQTLSGPCTAGSYHRPHCGVVWLGRLFARLRRSEELLAIPWQKGSSSGCNLQAAYITWLDTPYSGTAEVQQLQKYVVSQLKRPYWVNTELYSAAQIQANYSTYAPYQTIITGYWGASDVTSWAKGMCATGTRRAQPVRLASWTFYDMDLTSSESYRAYINGGMAAMGRSARTKGAMAQLGESGAYAPSDSRWRLSLHELGEPEAPSLRGLKMKKPTLVF